MRGPGDRRHHLHPADLGVVGMGVPANESMLGKASEFQPGPDAGEFSWGAGLVPKGNEALPPDQGGMYSGKCPPLTETAAAASTEQRYEARRAAHLTALDAELAARRGDVLDGAGDAPMAPVWVKVAW
ncbi:hypothetical protein OG921_10550 [Aldersonia sp. NBC_00410]|uniref:hypothetical protein n=1 Tax=Aldersonia sp. NBC_00410 TaxID=2975954 RepID=UPI002254F7C9|nr:hypothetical protein [Aldersonia sp. NBC_00410]MCX5043603.1 hypothetical protein [Aldersonia sp. NBC_00410]